MATLYIYVPIITYITFLAQGERTSLINILVIFLFVLLNQNTFNHTRFREVYQAYTPFVLYIVTLW